MERSAAVSSHDGRSKQQPSESLARRLPSGSGNEKQARPNHDVRIGIPLTSPSTISLQSSSTTGPRSRTHRTLSRPKWLDVEANGGLLKRKTEPALATVTVKGADSINRRDEGILPRRGDDVDGKGKEKPQMRKALTMDTVLAPRSKALPSLRRRVSQSPLYTACGVTSSEPSLLANDDPIVQSPEQESSGPLVEAPEKSRKETLSHSDPSREAPAQANHEHQKEQLDPNAPEEASSSRIAASQEDPAVLPVQNVSEGAAQPAQDSRLWAWGKWAYTYVPAIRRTATESTPTIAAEEADQLVDPAAASLAAKPLPDFQQLEDEGINEAIGAIPSSDTKDHIYDVASADEALSTGTEQGIGVDPAHRSEIPFFTDNRTNLADNKATWSLTGLATSAWNWKRGAENVPAVASPAEHPSFTTGVPVEGDSNASDKPTPARVDSDNIPAPHAGVAVDTATVASEPSALGRVGDAGHYPSGEDPPTLSRSAWAFAAASRWVPRRGSGIGRVDPQERATDSLSFAQEGPAGKGETTTVPHVQEPTPVPTAATVDPRNPSETNPSAAAQSIALTPEVLEARPSPLLPSSASMIVTTRPNLVLPSFNHTFRRPPRGHAEQVRSSRYTTDHNGDRVEKADMILRPDPERPVSPPSMAWRALGAVSQYARGGSRDSSVPSKPVNTDIHPTNDAEKSVLPIVTSLGKDQWQGVRRIVIIGVHGWFPNAHVQKVIGAPRGSSYFASMMGQAVLAQFEADFGVGQEAPEKVTYIPLDGEGTVDVRVEKLFKAYLSRPDWIRDVRRADAIFVAAHSQGTVVATHLLARFINQGHIRTPHNAEAVDRCEYAFGQVIQAGSPLRAKPSTSSSDRYPKVGLLAMCGVHQGPFYSSATSTVLQPYLNWFENAAARELFEFQDSHSGVVADYTKALDTILHHRVKTIFLASLDDQMVPIYSATFAAASHPLILRLLYVDAAIHSSTDFMINLIVFCLMLRNAGLDDQGLVGHLSEATAGAWRGAGHSTPYEDPGAYAFMVKYLLSTDCAADVKVPQLKVEDFTVRDAKNDYELPWILRGVMDDPDVKNLFAGEITELKENILSWNPTTRALKEMKKRLEPMAGRAALRQHQQKERLQRSSSFLSLASSEGQASARRQDELSSSPLGEGVQKKGLTVAVPTVMNADW